MALRSGEQFTISSEQLVQRVLAQRLQQRVARDALARFESHHQRFLNQLEQLVQDVFRGNAVATANSFGRVGRPATGEDRQSFEDTLLGAGQQLVTPVDRGAGCLLAWQCSAVTARHRAVWPLL
jgi:hypothetical protein